MKCFYHSADLDGHCSGAIVKMKYPDCELIGINYGDEFPWDSIEPGEVVYMVDFSLQPDTAEQMRKLAGLADLNWIDHHKTAIGLESIDHIKGLRKNGEAGCELTWQYCFPDEKMPYSVKLLGRYDVWDHDSDEHILPFQYGMRLSETRPYLSEAQSLWVVGWLDVCNEGEVILTYQAQQDAIYAKATAFETELDGLKCIACNKMLTNSLSFKSVWDSEKYDAMIAFGYRKGHWTISLYTDKEGVDVSTVAKERGGGGHKQAAGFQADGLPFRLK
jgi:oligoribonuclease NrnB/cAMP/cGMP phosphodiesterase (DHH superfamily)